jgi:hypothetical protein
MNTQERNEIRELTTEELHGVEGGFLRQINQVLIFIGELVGNAAEARAQKIEDDCAVTLGGC